MEPCTKLDFSNDDAVYAIVYSIRLDGSLFVMTTEQLSKTFLTIAVS